MKAKTPDSLFIKNGTVLTQGGVGRVLGNHGVYIEGGKIVKIAPMDEFRDPAFVKSVFEVLDARGKLVMPGLINTHMHFYSTLVRGLGKAKPSENFNEVLENLWWRLDRKLNLDDVYYSALIALIAAVRKGCTTLIDHHSSPGAATGSLARIAQAVKETGLRASLCYELSDRDGPQSAEEGMQENLSFIRHCQTEKSEHLRAHFGLHASFTVSEKTLERAVAEASSVGAGFHVHTAEAESDQTHSLNTFGVRVVERFKRAGVLGPKTICAHGVHINDLEMAILAETDTPLVHNPQSNMNNAVGAADLLRLQKHGVTTGLGTDAMTVNMFEELRSALWLQRISHKHPNVGFMEVTNALFKANANIANRSFGLGLGELKTGAAADVILVDYYSPTPLTDDTVAGHMIFGVAESEVDTTIVAGRVLMADKKLRLDIDEERISVRSQECADKLWMRF